MESRLSKYLERLCVRNASISAISIILRDLQKNVIENVTDILLQEKKNPHSIIVITIFVLLQVRLYGVTARDAARLTRWNKIIIFSIPRLVSEENAFSLVKWNWHRRIIIRRHEWMEIAKNSRKRMRRSGWPTRRGRLTGKGCEG